MISSKKPKQKTAKTTEARQTEINRRKENGMAREAKGRKG